MLAGAAQRTEARERAAAKKAERKQLARALAASRARYLDGLVGHLDELLRQVDALVTTKRQSDYDAAAKLIQDLHDVADRHGQLERFALRLQQLRAQHVKKVSLLERLDSAHLA